MTRAASSNSQDPYFFDREDLEKIADEASIRRGLAFYKENRVIEADQDRELLWGRVEDPDSDFPYDIAIRLPDDKNPSFQCGCGANQENAVCQHITAVLFAYADQWGESDELLSAAESAIKDRIKRGRAEIEVEPAGDEPWFGVWHATSPQSTTHFKNTYRVTIRSLKRRANFCSCPDFANNQLGTCKHIEAILHKISKHPEYESFKKEPVPFSYVYLAWDVEDAPGLHLYRPRELRNDLEKFLDDYFAPDGSFKGRIPDDFFRFTEIADGFGEIHIGEDTMEYARHLASKAARRPRFSKIQGRIKANGRVPGVKARLYPYQVEGTAFLAGKGRALLADDMGLGKTLQAISAASWLREHEGVKTSLIICPASLKQQWAREIGKFTNLTCQIVQGPPPERGVQYRRGCDFFVINYELVLRDLSLINETLRPDLIILDEAQRIKNWRTKVASAVKLIPSRYAFILTGTPLENRLEELYSLMQVVDPGVLGPLWRYMIDFHITDDKGKVLGYRNLSVLRQRLKPVMLRRDRRLVKDQLPDRVEQRLDVELTPKQRELHDAGFMAAGSLAQIAKRRPLTPTEQNRLIAALQQARMACDAAGLVDKETEGAPKIDELANILDEICLQSGLKAVIFSQWELMTQMVEQPLRRMGIGFVRLHGGVPTAKRGDLMKSFHSEDSVQVFLSTDAGGVGLNLQSASVLINLDIPWNPAVLEQRNSRVHRLGQKNKVHIITMVGADSYEEQVLSLIRNKQNLFDHVISEDASEDVVGVSKKLLDNLVEDLHEPAGSKNTEEEEQPPAAGKQKIQGEKASQEKKDRALEETLTRIVEELQKAFGPRLERIMGSGGGLLAVLDQVDSTADRTATHLSTPEVPVAVIDLRTLNGLSRLGANSPVETNRTWYDASRDEKDGKTSRLMALAGEKLKATRVLVEQALSGSALEMLLSAQLTAAADRAGMDSPVSTQEAGIWLYGEAIPGGLLNQKDADLITRSISLSQCPSVPEEMIADLLEETESFINAGGTTI